MPLLPLLPLVLVEFEVEVDVEVEAEVEAEVEVEVEAEVDVDVELVPEPLVVVEFDEELEWVLPLEPLPVVPLPEVVVLVVVVVVVAVVVVALDELLALFPEQAINEPRPTSNKLLLSFLIALTCSSQSALGESAVKAHVSRRSPSQR